MILWFRNDLRTHDNPALQYFLNNRSDNSPSKAIFFVSPKQWDLHDWSAIKIDLIHRHLELLKVELAHLDVELDLIEVDDFNQQVSAVTELVASMGNCELVANYELEVNEQLRDKQCALNGINFTLFESDVIVPKGKVLNQSGEMFKVFTPFKRAWLKYVRDYGFEYLPKLVNSTDISPDKLPNNTQGIKTPTANTPDEKGDLTSVSWPLVNVVEQQVIPMFIQDKLAYYDAERDIPSIKGTSGLSPYLAIGALSPRYLLRLVLNHHPDILMSPDLPLFTWINELIWRDFYRHLIFHNPNLSKHQCFNPKYQSAVWPFEQSHFDAWCEGKTGYPIVDAAMRQLNQTGWMHNRLRMIVASFLTKHLLIDWRKGEQYFMQKLIDGDLAANNGGWQWAASTGCDAQPYFRIFNPILQSKRFDPDGDFIRKYLPELAKVPAKEIHFPHTYIKKQNLNIYWSAIVDHKEAREAALSFYK